MQHSGVQKILPIRYSVWTKCLIMQELSKLKNVRELVQAEETSGWKLRPFIHSEVNRDIEGLYFFCCCCCWLLFFSLVEKRKLWIAGEGWESDTVFWFLVSYNSVWLWKWLLNFQAIFISRFFILSTNLIIIIII